MLALAIAAVVTAGCASKPPTIPVVTKPVIVERLIYVRVRSDLTAHDAQVAMPRNDSGRELLRVASERKAQVLQCHAKLDAIAQIEGTTVSPSPAKPASTP